jgi:AcrR family transcriptional regulator
MTDTSPLSSIGGNRLELKSVQRNRSNMGVDRPLNNHHYLEMGRHAGVKSDDTRRRLLVATMQILVERGFEGTRVFDIAREAGVTSGAIYNHFSSKAELLTAAIAEQSPHVISDVLASGGESSVIEAFRQVGSSLPDRSASTLAPLLLELIVSSTRDIAIADVLSGEFSEREHQTGDAIRLGQAAGEIDGALDAEALTRFVMMLAFGSLVAASLNLKPMDRRALGEVIDHVLDSIRSDKERP